MREYRAKNLEKMREYGRAQFRKNRESILERKRRWRAVNHDKLIAEQRAYRAANSERYKIYNERAKAKRPPRQRPPKMTPEQRRQSRREQWFRRTYGISVQIFEEMFAKQNGKCAICKCKSDKWVVDHCHNNGHVRGILCNNCNLAIGLLKHSAVAADAARDYLA